LHRCRHRNVVAHRKSHHSHIDNCRHLTQHEV
jgi:hypothetical protein